MELQLQERDLQASAGDSTPIECDAAAEELGEAWSPHGAEWAWANDGQRQNGWIRLCQRGRANTKWGGGTWQLLAAGPQPPLLLVTFNSVEHALRLTVGNAENGSAIGFDVVSKRRLAQ